MDQKKHDGEVRELTKEDLAQFVPFADLPADLQSLFALPKTVTPDGATPTKRKPAA